MKLGAKLRMSYVGIVLIAVSLVLILIMDNANKDLKEKIGKDLQYVSKTEADFISGYAKKKIYDIKILSRDSLFKSADAPAAEEYLSKIKSEEAGFDRISVINLEGKVVISTDKNLTGRPFIVPDKKLADLYEQAKRAKKGDVFFKYVHENGLTEKLKGYVFTPVMDRNDTDVAFVMAATMNMDRILKDADSPGGHVFAGKKAFLEDNKATMIITQEGKSRVFTPIVYIQGDSSLLKHAKEGGDGYATYRGTDGAVSIAGYASLDWYGKVKDRPWLVISVAPEKEVFSPAVRLRNTVTVLGAVSVVVAWIIAVFVARGITRPILKLVDVTNKIAKGDLSQRADIMQGDEVGDLARSFNKMTDELNSAIASCGRELIGRKNVEEKLKEEMEEKSNFISMVSYEFKTSLTAIKESLHVFLDEMSDKINDKQKNLLLLAKKSGESLSRLIGDIVDFQQIESGEVKFKMAENDINEVIEDVRKEMTPLLTEKKEVEFVIETDKELPEIRFDREKIALVLENVINLAVRSTEKGSIKVATLREGDKAIRVSVSDTGPGIDRKDLPKLFAGFEQVGKEKDREAGGTGLGLAISKAIIERHNGKIWAESEKGKGTTVSFTLPLLQ